MLERDGARGEAVAREQRGEQAVARAMTDMQRLRHGAEVGLDAGGERGRDRKRGCGLRPVEPHQVARRRGGAEHAEGRGRMPALVVVVKVDAERDLALGFEAGDIGRDEVAAAGAGLSREREQRRQDRRRRMAAQGVVAVVEVERVRGGAVDQRRIERVGAVGGAEHEARAARRRNDLPRIRAAGSRLPATVTPIVSRMPTLAQCTACGGRSSNRSAAERRESSSARCMLSAPSYSALMPAARITLPHRSVSSATSLPNSAGEPGRRRRRARREARALDRRIGEHRVDLPVEPCRRSRPACLSAPRCRPRSSPRSPARTRPRSAHREAAAAGSRS